jgi:hypothetical protein
MNMRLHGVVSFRFVPFRFVFCTKNPSTVSCKAFKFRRAKLALPDSDTLHYTTTPRSARGGGRVMEASEILKL